MAQHHASGERIMRRVAGYHDYRLDGLTDLLTRAYGLSVLDIGCNRGRVGLDFTNNGAVRYDGIELDRHCVDFARELHVDNRGIDTQIEQGDLTKGKEAFFAFGGRQWDIVLFLATYHKLRRVMQPKDLEALVRFLGSRTIKYFVWRGTDKRDENETELREIDKALEQEKLVRVHTSYLSKQIGAAAIWER